MQRQPWATSQLGGAFLGAAMLLATICAAADAAEIAIRERVIQATVEGTSVPVPVSGRITTSAADGGGEAEIFLAADLSQAQRLVAPILRSRLDRNDSCGDNVQVQDAMLVPSPPAARITTRLSYGRAVCIDRGGKRYRTTLFRESGTVVLDVTPGVRDGAITVSVRVVSVEAQGLLGPLLRDPQLLQPIADQVARDAINQIEELVPTAVRNLDPVFRQLDIVTLAGGGLGLHIVAARSMTAAEADALAAALNGGT